MVLNKQQVADVTVIMSMKEEMVTLLPKIKHHNLNPFTRQLPGLFRGLKLKPGQTILDIPCGKGDVSIPLAKKYGVTVKGYDLLQNYIQEATETGKKLSLDKLCQFIVGDIRTIVKKRNVCDVLLWIAAPTI